MENDPAFGHGLDAGERAGRAEGPVGHQGTPLQGVPGRGMAGNSDHAKKHAPLLPRIPRTELREEVAVESWREHWENVVKPRLQRDAWRERMKEECADDEYTEDKLRQWAEECE